MGIELVWAGRGLYKKYAGAITSKDLVCIKEQNLGDARFDRLLYTICDFSGVEKFDYEKADLDLLCALDRSTFAYHRDLHIATVVADADISSVLKSLGESRISPYPREVFCRISDAHDWIAKGLKAQGYAGY